MLMQINNFSTSVRASSSIWGKTNEVYNKSKIKRERSKIYSDFDDKFTLTRDILTSVWIKEESETVVLNIEKSLDSEKNIVRVSRNYFFIISIVYSLTAVAVAFTTILLFESKISTGDFMVGAFSALAFAIGSAKVLNESKKRVVLQWQKTQTPK